MKKHSLWLEVSIIFAIIVLSLSSYFIFFHSSEQGASIVIEGDHVTLAEYSLDTERLVLIEKIDGKYTVSEISFPYSVSSFKENYNLIHIKDGSVRVIEADCPASGSTRCTNQGSKHYSGSSIICLEHGLVITIRGGERGELDLVSK